MNEWDPKSSLGASTTNWKSGPTGLKNRHKQTALLKVQEVLESGRAGLIYIHKQSASLKKEKSAKEVGAQAKQ